MNENQQESDQALDFDKAQPSWVVQRFVELPAPWLAMFFVYALFIFTVVGLLASYLIVIPVTVRGTGTIVSEIKPVEIRAPTNIAVRKIMVRENDEVKAGQVLFETDRTVTKSMRDAAREVNESFAKIYQRHKRLECTVACSRDALFIRDKILPKLELMDLFSDSGELKRSLTQFATAEQKRADLPGATRDLNREMQLAQQKLKSIRQSGAQNLLSLDLEKLESQVESLRSQIRAQQTNLRIESESAREQVKFAIERLNETLTIASNQNSLQTPVSGIVKMLAPGTEGQKHSAGEVLAQITPMDSAVAMEFLVQERDMNRIRLGQTVKAEIGSYPSREFGFITSEVANIGGDAELVQGRGAMFKIRARVERNLKSQKGKLMGLKPGMTVEADVIVRRQRALIYFSEIIFNLLPDISG